MPDLRERLRAIESTPPPDLWNVIEARALEDRPEDVAEVIAFEPRRRDWPRRLAAAAVAVAVFALGMILVWRGFRPSPRPVPTPKPKPAVLPDGWERCTNSVHGYSIGYPGAWFTTDVLNAEQDPTYACQWFDTRPFGPDGNVVSEGFAYPLEVGVRIGGLADVLADETTGGVQVLSQEETSVADHRAVRIEVEVVDSPMVDAGVRIYVYLVELAPDQTMRIFTADEPGIAGGYEENRHVVDQAVDTLRFADPVSGELPEGWQRCTNEQRGFDLGYPGDWYTTDIFFGDRRQQDACTIFASLPFELQTDTGDPFGMAVEEGCGYPVCIRFIPTSLDDLLGELTDPQRIQVISQSEETINGRRAVVLDRDVLEPTLGEQTGPSYHYLIELNDRHTILLTTEGRDNTVGDGTRTQDVLRVEDYEANRAVMDQMVQTIRFSV